MFFSKKIKKKPSVKKRIYFIKSNYLNLIIITSWLELDTKFLLNNCKDYDYIMVGLHTEYLIWNTTDKIRPFKKI